MMDGYSFDMGQLLQFTAVAFRSLLSHKLRSLLSILGIVCGVLAVMVMLATGEGAKQKVLSELEGLGLKNIYIEAAASTEKNGGPHLGYKSYGLTWDDIARLKQQEYVERAAGMKELRDESFAQDKDVNATIVYASAGYMRITGKEIGRGRQLHPDDTAHNNLVCVLGAGISRVLGPAGRVGEFLRLKGQLYKVVGVLKTRAKQSSEVKEIARENSDEMIFLSFPLSFVSKDDALQLQSKTQLNRIVVKIWDTVDVIGAAEAIDRLLYLNHHSVRDYSMVVPRELLNQSLKTQAVFNLFLSITGGISLFVGGIGIMNIMLANVSERKREIGIRRAVGATRRHIVLQFLTESVLLTLVGAVTGILLGFVSVLLIEQFAGWAVQVTLLSLILPFFLAIFAGVFFGLYPAIQAANLEPITALKSL